MTSSTSRPIFVSAQLPGTVCSISAPAGTCVQTGDVLVLLESMKMEIAVQAPTAGTILHVDITPGQQVVQGPPLLSLRPKV